MTLLTNIAIGATGLGIVGGLAYGGYRLFKDNSQSILELLKKNDKTLLTESSIDSSKWNTNWTSYINDNSTSSKPNAKDIWELTDWNEKKSVNNFAPQSFKDKCKDLSTKKVIDNKDEIYKKVEKYCTK